jgi:hypothetical protein
MRNVVTQTRRAYDTLVVFTSVAGETLNLGYQLMAQGLFTFAEVLTTMASIQTLTTLDVFRGALGFIAAAALFTKGAQVLSEGEISHAALNASINVGSTWRLHG